MSIVLVGVRNPKLRVDFELLSLETIPSRMVVISSTKPLNAQPRTAMLLRKSSLTSGRLECYLIFGRRVAMSMSWDCVRLYGITIIEIDTWQVLIWEAFSWWSTVLRCSIFRCLGTQSISKRACERMQKDGLLGRLLCFWSSFNVTKYIDIFWIYSTSLWGT